MVNRNIFFRALLWLCCASVSYAAEQVIQVTGNKEGKGVTGTFSRMDLKKDRPAASGLSAILEEQSGVHVEKYGAPGSRSHLMIRGANPEHTGVYLDGMELNNPLGGPVNLESLPMEMFESAELYRSSVPAHLPGSHIGGALDLIPFSPEGERTFLQSSATSLQGAGLVLGRMNQNSAHFLQMAGSRNRYEYLDHGGTPLYNTADDQLRNRNNEDFSRIGYTGIFRRLSGDHALKALADFQAFDRGLPGVIGAEVKKAREVEGRGMLNLKDGWYLSPEWSIDLGLGFLAQRREISDPDRELATGLTSRIRDAGRVQSQVMPIWQPKENITLRLPLEFAATSLRESAGIGRAERESAGAGLAGEIFLAGGITRLVFSGKENFHRQKSDNSSEKNTALPSLTGRVGFFPGVPLKIPLPEIFAEASVQHRIPSLVENFGDGATVLPAPDLRSEKALTNTAGLEGSLPCPKIVCSLRAAVFQTRAEDLILFTPNSQKTLVAVNAGLARLRGLETEWQWNYQEWLTQKITYTLLEALDFSDFPYYNGKILPWRPRHQFSAYQEGGTRQWRLFTRVIWRGAVYRDRYNSAAYYVPSRFTLDFGAVYFCDAERCRATISFNNVTDEKTGDAIGYPLPGRNAEVKFTWNWPDEKPEKKTP